MFPYGDDNYEIVPINFNFTYFHYFFDTLTIDTNGFIYFSGKKCCDIALRSDSNAISGLNYDLNTASEGEIVYENVYSNSSDFGLIKSDINRLNSAFVPTNVFRITYYNVPDYFEKINYASFQVILASDSSKNYVALKYYSCLSGLSLLSSPGLNYLNQSGHNFSIKIENPCGSSNVNLTGTWVFDVSLPSSEGF